MEDEFEDNSEEKTENSYGSLYYLEYSLEGEWMNKINNMISSLYCKFEEETNILPNGINLNQRYDYKDKNIYKLDKELSSFLLRCYMIKNLHKIDSDGILCNYKAPVNLVLNYIDRDYVSIINKKCVEQIKTILNHPTFYGCKSLNEIKSRFLNIKLLNERFN